MGRGLQVQRAVVEEALMGGAMMFGLRAKLLFPLGVLVLVWGVYTIAIGQADPVGPGVFLIFLVVLLGVMATNVELVVLRPLRSLLAAAHELAQSRFAGAPVDTSSLTFQQLAVGLNRLRDRMQEYEATLIEEQARRKTLEQSVRELEDRYSLTVERANDGIWEWDLKTDTAAFSVRWKAMVGHLHAPLGNIKDWRDLLHPEERASVVLRLEDHIQGRTSHFDEEYRLRHSDGYYRWVHSRGTAIRHANGKAYRLIVMDNDIHGRKQIEQTLIEAAEALSSVSGADFYKALMQSLSSILGTRDNLVCYCVGDPPTRAQTLVYYSNGKFFDNFEYDLAGTSCGAVIERKEIVYAPSGVCDIWPLEKEFDRDSYIGVPMFDSTGKIIGHFACMDGKPMRQDLPHLALFRIFSVRAAAELERMLLRQKLEGTKAPS
jgi:PAS domain S-box-containing protein